MPKRLSPSTSLDQLTANVGGSDSDQKKQLQAIATEYGFASWRQLEVYLSGYHTKPSKSELHFLQLCCLDYQTHIHDFDRAASMVEQHPDLVDRDIYHACSIGDVEAVSRFLSKDPSLVNARGGYFDWEPLLYACYSRLDIEGYSTLEVARLLLENGADPNAKYMWGGQYVFSAITGAFGEGENGSVNCPEHPQSEPLARLLLEAGASPNDSQALYNRMFTPGSECLSLLIEFGLGPQHKCNWLLDDGTQMKPQDLQTLRYQLRYAIKSGYPARARMCVDAGATLETEPNEKSLYEQAMLSGDRQLADYLVANGAEQPELDEITRFASACQAGDEALASSMLATNTDLMKQTQAALPELVVLAAEGGRENALRLIAKLGGDLSSGCPMQQAAWQGQLKMVRLLVELGVSVQHRDPTHRATPLQWACHHDDRDDVIAYLSTCDIDIFDAVICSNLDRIEELLAADSTLLEVPYSRFTGRSDPADARTPLASAVTRGREDVVRFLLAKGASAEYFEDGKSLLELAREHATPAIADLLAQ